jgi:putative FmdB family regulatory protein
MPTYQFECGSCGEVTKRFASMSAAPKTIKCPNCGARAKRLIGAGAGLLFKGSGFYITDYRSSDYRRAANKDSSPPSGAGSGDGKSAKPSTKAGKKGGKKTSG